jgi:membrane protein DedA with SNARE-associated domain
MSLSLDHLLSTYGAPLVGIVIGLEAMGLPLPGESILIAGALYCATTHRLSIVWMLAAAIAGAIVGDNVGYLIGRSLGFRLLSKYGRRVGISDDRLMLGRALFTRYGGVVVFFGRFVAVLRTFAALLAGANRMSWSRFLLWNTLGGVCWAGGYGSAAYVLGAEIRHVEGPVAIGIATMIVCLAGYIFFYIKRHEDRLIEAARRQAGMQDIS